MNKRTTAIYVRVTEKEKSRIKQKADKCGLSQSEKESFGIFAQSSFAGKLL